jgi:hypothetical protein
VCAGYLPSSGGLCSLEGRLSAGAFRQGTLDSTHASSSAGSGGAVAGGYTGAAYPGSSATHKRWLRSSDGKVRGCCLFVPCRFLFVATMHTLCWTDVRRRFTWTNLAEALLARAGGRCRGSTLQGLCCSDMMRPSR